MILPLMIEDNRAMLSLFHYESLLSKVYRRDTRDSSSYVYFEAAIAFIASSDTFSDSPDALSTH